MLRPAESELRSDGWRSSGLMAEEDTILKVKKLRLCTIHVFILLTAQNLLHQLCNWMVFVEPLWSFKDWILLVCFSWRYEWQRVHVRNARSAFRNLHVDPLSLHTSMRNKQVEFNPYIYTLSELSRFGYEVYTIGRFSEQSPEQPV